MVRGCDTMVAQIREDARAAAANLREAQTVLDDEEGQPTATQPYLDRDF